MQVPDGKKIRVNGIVQGVGFRPFVHLLAKKYSLTGSVKNTSEGVFLEFYGDSKSIDAAVSELQNSPPPLSQIDNISIESIDYKDVDNFSIILSDGSQEKTVAITPDACVCDDCVKEMLDPNDRRYHYPFINCTNCGPRYSIIKDVPYDRKNTSMHKFTMCPLCQEEYDSIETRRYHAQPNCCEKCGPKLTLTDNQNNEVESDDIIQTSVDLMNQGKILAIKGIGGFHLACDATNSNAVAELRKRKQREEKPLAVMVKNYQVANKICEYPEYAEKILKSSESPILIGKKKDHKILSELISPNNDYYGLMLPYTPIHILLFERGAEYLVMTSANLSDEPIYSDNEQAFENLKDIVDYFVFHDRDINIRVDDSVVMANSNHPVIIRRARGYVPVGIETGVDVNGIAGFGPMLKNTPALGRGTVIYPGQHIGDLNNRRSLDMFENVLDNMKKILGVEISKVACDLHPDYPSTHLAEESGVEVVKVQHHHAHLLSIMAEKRIYEKSIGVSFDGTGYGDDGNIWGGEIFTFDPKSYDREYHLEYVGQPGGDKAAEEPWRMAVSYLVQNGIDYKKYIKNDNASVIENMIRSDMNVFQTSSMGRLFDIVSCLCGFCDINSYEAKAAMILESRIEKSSEHYDFEFENGIIKTGELIKQIIKDLDNKIVFGIISAKFHNTVVEMVLRAVKKLRDLKGLQNVFLSGGVFMNGYLIESLTKRLNDDNYNVFTHTLLPPNDGGVSSGQLLYAAFN